MIGALIIALVVTILGGAVFFLNWYNKYNDLRLEWEEQNVLVDTLTCDRDKYKKEISYLRNQIDSIVVTHDEETQKMTAKYEKKIADFKEKLKIAQANVDALTIKEAEYLTSLEESAMREASLINTVEKLEKDLEKATKKKVRTAAKKKKEEKTEEQLEIAFEEDVNIATGEGEIKCEKKRRRKKGDSK